MTTPSPSEFLTFHRHITLSARSTIRQATLRNRSALRPIQQTYSRPFTASSIYAAKKEEKEHSTTKHKQGDTLDVQTDSVKKGVDAKSAGTGGHATEQRDSAGGKAKAKKDYPEAPDVAIGMQDERGRRGA